VRLEIIEYREESREKRFTLKTDYRIPDTDYCILTTDKRIKLVSPAGMNSGNISFGLIHISYNN